MDGKAAAAPPRHVLHVDRQRCLGCGQCLGSCPRGLLAVREHSACLVDASRCDGRGACLGHCSADALSLRPRALAG
ncbi:4Fe-4S binding protein [Solidesulfovibrio sp.]|uniref:ATP-binding protein n=1 Tax=Solidesulfovibrio sp. TaxID=2910990 RepID=UPI00263233F8|nr:4Fe-4S binding protein [Solidesulfovibrio sp.]